jgi:hypothetical protein
MRLLNPPGFPPEVREVFEALRHEVAFLHACWDAFKQLYGTEESVAALNDTAPGAFQLIGFLFRREFIMGVCRLTDRKDSRVRKVVMENLTLKQLLHLVGEHCADVQFLANLTAAVADIDKHCEPIRDRRNRAIGHLDLQTALNYHPDPLPSVTSAHIDEALRLIRDFMNEVNGYFAAAHADFTPVIHGPARNIVHGLKEFQRLRKLNHQRQLAELQEEAQLRHEDGGPAAGEVK